MTTAQIVYGINTDLTHTLTGLASDTNLIAGRESTARDNTTDDAIDAIVQGKATTGTTPTASRQIEVWAYGSVDGTTYSAGATGTDANFSPTGEKTLMKLLTIIPTDATSDHVYNWGPFSIAQAFGGTMPRNWGIFIVHNTGVAFNITAANQETTYTPVKYESV